MMGESEFYALMGESEFYALMGELVKKGEITEEECQRRIDKLCEL